MKKFLTTILSVALVIVAAMTASAQNLPPTWVFARAYNGWQIQGQTANTYTFNGGACYFSPYVGGITPPFFVFSGVLNATTVYNPVAILDATPANSEIVTPSSTTNGPASCGFAGTTANSHTSFVLSSGTAGLQEAIYTQAQQSIPANVILDQTWYNYVAALPGQPTPESLIKAAKGTTSVAIVDTTTSPWMYWRWNVTTSAYIATAYSGGSSAPTAAAGAAAGTSPTGPTNSGDGNTMTVSLTTGTATTTGTLFTETWATSNAFLYPPFCSVWSSGTNAFTAFTTAVTFPSSTHALLTVTASSAPVASTAYQFKVVCQ